MMLFSTIKSLPEPHFERFFLCCVFLKIIEHKKEFFNRITKFNKLKINVPVLQLSFDSTISNQAEDRSADCSNDLNKYKYLLEQIHFYSEIEYDILNVHCMSIFDRFLEKSADFDPF